MVTMGLIRRVLHFFIVAHWKSLLLGCNSSVLPVVVLLYVVFCFVAMRRKGKTSAH